MAHDLSMATNMNQSGDGTLLRSGKVLDENAISAQLEKECNLGLGGSVRRKTPHVASTVTENSQVTPVDQENNDDPGDSDIINDAQTHTVENTLQDMFQILAEMQNAAAVNQHANNVAQNVQNQAVQRRAVTAVPCQTVKENRVPGSKMKPPIYDGTSSWMEYLLQFNLVAELNAWNDRTKALHLATSLRGVARSILADMDPNLHHDFSALVACLNQRFGPDNQSEMFWMMLNNRTRKPQETLPELAHEVRQLVRLAHPNAQHQMLEELAMRHFSNAISNTDMRLRIVSARPKTLDDAVKVAVETEAFYEAEKFRTGSKKPVRAVTAEPTLRVENDSSIALIAAFQESMKALISQLDSLNLKRTNRSSTTCFYCGKFGHIKKDCRKFLANSQNQPKHKGN